MSGYSGSPIFPADDAFEPQAHNDPYGAPSAQPPAWADAEQTTLLPPTPPAPHGPDERQGPSASRFGQIHEKYATSEVPLPEQLYQQAPQQALHQPPQQAPSWPEDWAQPVAAPVAAPPQAWQPQSPAEPWQQPPYGAQPVQHQTWSEAEQTTLLPPVPPAPAPGQPHYAQPYPEQQPAGQPHAGQAYPGQPQAGQSYPGQPHPGQAYPEQQPAGQPHAGQPYAGEPQAGQPHPGQPHPGQAYPGQPQAGQSYPGQPHPGQPHAGQSYAGQSYAAGPGYAPAPAAPMPAGVTSFAPEPNGWSDAKVTHAAPTSLRETFAAAHPTGPAGPVAPPPPAPLDAQPGGSLREAFAAAEPTGPSGASGSQPPFAAPPTAPAAAQRPGSAPNAGRIGSPIIDPGVQPAAATLAIGLLIALAALLGRPALVLPTLLLQAVTSAGWFRLNGMWPARQGIALAALGGFTADAAMLAASGGTAPAVLAGTLGGFFLLVLILQIFRPSNPDERFYALTVSASATVMTILAGCFLAAGTITHHGWSSGAVVLVGTLSAAVAVLLSAVPGLPAKAGFGAGAVIALACGALLGVVTGMGLGGALLGLAAGSCALVGRRVAAYDFPSRFVHLTAGVALPLACAAPAVFLVGHLLAG
ncbi:hypothetical protein ABIA33_000813 [Streptacidiphilus sp. MAP12-16]|uniref:hypothetical protein n=1 Tax=Streptacidiphilus sp. MAP12-16 TaxID=3156300 RepID=UPI0035133EE4